jgi:hypothetical protein
MDWVPPLKAGEIYARELGKLVGSAVSISPFCCGESGLGALTSPKITTACAPEKRSSSRRTSPDSRPTARHRRLPVMQDRHQPLPARNGAQREVLHSLEFLAKLRHGDTWRKGFHKQLAKAAVQNGVQVVTLAP